MYKQAKDAESRLRQAEQGTPLPQTSPTEFAKQPPEFAKQQPEFANSAECAKQQPEYANPKECARVPEYAKQQAAQADRGEATLPPVEAADTDERQAQLCAIASDVLYWKNGLKVLRQAQLPTWRGSFQWQIEAQIESLQAAYTRLRAEAAKEGG